MTKKKTFLTAEVPKLLSELTPDHKRAFGRMTPQHMVEHLIWVTKSAVKDHGQPPDKLSDSQLGFMRFVQKGAHLLHRPGDPEKNDLPTLRMKSLKDAVNEIPVAIQRIYDVSTDHHFYNPLMGILTFEEMEHFHYMHYKYHLQHQYGLGLY